MLTKLEDVNSGPQLFKEPWAKLLRDLISLGPDAIPELIEEVDATNDDRMLRCLGVSLRAIGDKRAIPALIRAIPKTLRPSSSDMGLRIDNDETLLKFMQKYDLDDRDSGNEFYDLETGQFANLPERWHGISLSADDIIGITKWAAEEGFDMMGDEYKDDNGNAVYAIRTIDLQAWQLSDSRWKSLPPKFTAEELQSEGHPVTGEWLLFRDNQSGKIDPQKNAPFFFVTREGTPGVLYVGIPVIDDSLKPGGATNGDNDLDPVSFRKGRRFGVEGLVPAE